MTQNKPQIKREVAVTYHNKRDREINFYATNDAAAEFMEYGNMIKALKVPNMYTLKVDPRFDFNEVLDFINSYG